MKVINKLTNPPEDTKTEADYKSLVCAKLNELTSDNFFSIGNAPLESITASSCSNNEYTIVFAVATIACSGLAYFTFCGDERPIVFHKSTGYWKEIWTNIRRVTEQTIIEIRNP